MSLAIDGSAVVVLTVPVISVGFGFGTTPLLKVTAADVAAAICACVGPSAEAEAAEVRRYTAEFIGKVVGVVGTSIRNLEPARISFGQGAAGFAVNRRRAQLSRGLAIATSEANGQVTEDSGVTQPVSEADDGVPESQTPLRLTPKLAEM